jgi:hypothetical protein
MLVLTQLVCDRPYRSKTPQLLHAYDHLILILASDNRRLSNNKVTNNIKRTIWGSHSGGYEEFCLQQYKIFRYIYIGKVR